MTDEELKALVASLAVSQKETDKQIKELRTSQEENGKFIKELRISQKETGKFIKETIAAQKIAQKETDKQIKELGKQIGGLVNKFGSFTEGMALPSMEEILRKHFGMTVISPRTRVRKNGKCLELDVFAYSNGAQKTVCIVEIKSHIREDSLIQMLEIVREFSKFFPDHADKKLYGILAGVDIPENVKNKVLESGIYIASIRNEHFKLQVPKNFKAKNFQSRIN